MNELLNLIARIDDTDLRDQILVCLKRMNYEEPNKSKSDIVHVSSSFYEPYFHNDFGRYPKSYILYLSGSS